ncbi:spermidine/putrescine transport system substrate-binding protein [Paracoccus halophilus]|nr:PotD/PotF family extracellular solute-binding protein [Paracoccus halophilus]SFA61433.1 spermidine/putrescine transport system substrate-binding protein [Paracoccus halophilus]
MTRNNTGIDPSRSTFATEGQGLSRRAFVTGAMGAAIGAGALGAPAIAQGNQDVVVLSWTSYITPQIVAIMREHGLNVRGVPAATDADMFTKLKAGGASAYDIVWGNCGWAPTYHKAGLIEPFDPKSISGSDQIWSEFIEHSGLPYVLEDKKILLLPNSWDSYGLIWNTDKYQPTDPISWNALWDENVPKGKVMMRDSPEDFLAISGLALGVSRDEIYAMTGDRLMQAARHLADLKPFQIAAGEEMFIDALRSGKAWLGQCSNLAMSARLNRMQGREQTKAVIPAEGSLGWVDGPMLVSGARNRDAALRYLEVWNSLELQEYLYETYGFPPCSRAATQNILEAGGDGAQLLKDRGADKPDAALKLLFVGPPDNPGEWARAYTEVVGG